MLQLLLAAADPTEHVSPHTLFEIGHWFRFNNQMLMALLAGVLMILIFPRLFKDARGDAPRGARNFFESVLQFLRIEVFRPALKEHTDRFTPFLWCLFFFILFCNLLGQLPVDSVVTIATGGRESHFWGTATGSFNTTGALAVVCFIMIHVNGVRQVARSLMDGTYGHHPHHEEHTSDGGPGHEAAHDLEHMRGEALPAEVGGNLDALKNPTAHYYDDDYVKAPHRAHGSDHAVAAVAHGHKIPANIAWIAALPLYIWNFAPHPFRPPHGAPARAWLPDIPMWFFLLILEVIGAFIKPFALTVRLFANMIAGHIVLASLLLLIPVTQGVLSQVAIGAPVTILSLLIHFLELFVAFLQAYIFTFLATLFLASSIAPEH